MFQVIRYLLFKMYVLLIYLLLFIMRNSSLNVNLNDFKNIIYEISNIFKTL